VIDSPKTSVLFSGYAPVHFVCFRPLFEMLKRAPGVEVFVSGGLRSKIDGKIIYDLAGLYEPLGIDHSHMLTVDEIRDREFDCLFAANTKMIAPKRVNKRVQIFHGVSFRNKAVRSENAGADHYFIVGPYMRRAFASTGIIADDDPRACEIGFMKTDRLLNGELDSRKTLSSHGMSGDRPVIIYAPTGQKHNSLETMGEEVIKRIAATNEFDLIIKPHDHPKNLINWTEQLSPMMNKHTVLSTNPDVIELLQAADVLITDASSVSNEFSLLNRPMIFLDVPKLIKKASSKEGAMVDLNTWGRQCGSVVETPDQIINTVEHAMADPNEHEDIRKAMASDLFFNPGRATEAAFEWLKDSVFSGAITETIQSGSQ